MDRVSKYNEWFRVTLGKSHPVLITLIERREHQGYAYFCGTIDHQDVGKVIRISNYGGEITVLVGLHHVHFGHESEATWDADFAEAMDWISELMEGKVFVCSKYFGEIFLSSLSTPTPNTVPLNEGERLEVLRYPDP
jgi:hypothetical protein